MTQESFKKVVEVVKIVVTAAISIMSTLFATSCCGVQNPFS